MPVVIPRDKNIPLCPPTLSQEQQDKLWEQLVRNYLKVHPETIRKEDADEARKEANQGTEEAD